LATAQLNYNSPRFAVPIGVYRITGAMTTQEGQVAPLKFAPAWNREYVPELELIWESSELPEERTEPSVFVRD
jgi:hypothetical protein